MKDLRFGRHYLIITMLILGGVFFSGFYFGKRDQLDSEKFSGIINRTTATTTSVDFGPFWKVWDVINEKYIPTNSTSTDRVPDQIRIYGAISGMVNSLGDPYTMFFPPVESKSFNEEISGTIEGVGMEVGMKDGVLTVISPIKDTPAFRAGVKAGDIVIKIENILTNTLNTEEAINLIRGK